MLIRKGSVQYSDIEEHVDTLEMMNGSSFRQRFITRVLWATTPVDSL